MNVQIRPATVDDNAGLIELSRCSPMRGVLTAYSDRTPNFFALSSLQGKDSWTFAALDRDRIIGCFSCIGRTVKYAGRAVRELYAGDLKVLPSARRGRVAAELARRVVKTAESEGFDIVVSEVMGNNTAALKVLQWTSENVVSAQSAGVIHNMALLPYRRYSLIKGYDINPGQAEDVGPIAALLRRTYSNYNHRPSFGEEAFRQQLSQHPSFSVRDFLVARRQGRIVACAGFWDQHPIRRTVVLEFNWKGELLRQAIRFARQFMSLGSPPASGKPLQTQYMRFPACLPGHIEGLSALIRHKLENARHQRKFHFIWAGFHESDPLQECLRDVWRTGVDVSLFTAAIGDRLPHLAPEGPTGRACYVDQSLI